MFWRARALKC